MRAMIVPDFIGEGCVTDRGTGISIQVTGLPDLEDICVWLTDNRFGTRKTFFGGLLWRDKLGNVGTHYYPGDRLCGYELGAKKVGDYVKQSGLSVEDLENFFKAGLRMIASQKFRMPEEEIIIRLKLVL